MIVACDALDVDALIEVLWKPKNALAKQYDRLFEIEGVKLSFPEDALRASPRRPRAASRAPAACARSSKK